MNRIEYNVSILNNENLRIDFLSKKKKISEAKEKLKNLTQSLKTIRICGKECDIHIRDLMIDYDCITKASVNLL